MDKLLANEGGQPFYLEDISFMQNSTQDILKGIARGLGVNTDNYILYGCNVTIASAKEGVHAVTWNDGYIVIAGEAYPVLSGSLNMDEGADIYWVVKSALSGKRTYENGSEQNVYQCNTVTLQTSFSAGDVYVLYKDTITLPNAVSRGLQNRYSQDSKNWDGTEDNFLRNSQSGVTNIFLPDKTEFAGKIFCIAESGSLTNNGQNYIWLRNGTWTVGNSAYFFYKGIGINSIYIYPGSYVILRAIPTYNENGDADGCIFDVVNTEDFSLYDECNIENPNTSRHLKSTLNACCQDFGQLKFSQSTIRFSALCERYVAPISNTVTLIDDSEFIRSMDDLYVRFSILVLADNFSITSGNSIFKSLAKPDGVSTLTLSKGKEYTFHCLKTKGNGTNSEWYVTASGTA